MTYMDEVLCGTVQALVAYHNSHYNTTLRFEDFNTYKYEDVWGGSREEATEKVREFYATDHFLERMQVVPGAREALMVLKDHYELVIITARQEFVQKETHEFVNLHYPGIFKEIHFANHFLSPEEAARMVSKTKSELCREVGANILVDDSLAHMFECAGNGIRVFLFDHEGGYAWNKLDEDIKLPTNAERVHQWDDVVKALVPGHGK
ncbi:hypothetical protein HDU98_003309 [Podochytrium sp. JEL0797]|nr:hypothetical protein HDU98_003309 [Podochytrium sp. JEL0797]